MHTEVFGGSRGVGLATYSQIVQEGKIFEFYLQLVCKFEVVPRQKIVILNITN